MEAKPLIKQGWLRALLFVIVFLIVASLTMALVNWLTGLPFTLKNAGATSNAPAQKTQGQFMLLKTLLPLAAAVLTVFGFRKLIDKQTMVSLGLAFKNNISHAAAGFFLGIFLLGAGSLILIASNSLHWTDIIFDVNELFIWMVSMFLIAFGEELVCRGYVLNNLLQSMNKWMALVISALVFALLHWGNPGISLVALINIFLAGILLGVNYIYTKNLWFGILFHFSWNFYQGPILGYKVSGVTMQSLLEQDLNGNPLLTGGPFGFEGSILDGVLSILSILLLAWVYEKRYTVKEELAPLGSA